MADEKYTAQAVEGLLGQIAQIAHSTEQMLRNTDATGSYEEAVLESTMLRETVARLGWLSDLALTKINSVHRIHDGNAVPWMTWPITSEAIGKI